MGDEVRISKQGRAHPYIYLQFPMPPNLFFAHPQSTVYFAAPLWPKGDTRLLENRAEPPSYDHLPTGRCFICTVHYYGRKFTLMLFVPREFTACCVLEL